MKRNRIRPAQCLVILNASNEVIDYFISNVNKVTLDDVLKKTWDDSVNAKKIGHTTEDGNLSSTDYTYLTMTNSTYVDADGNVRCAVPVSLDDNFLRAEWFGALNPYLPWEGSLTYYDDEKREEVTIPELSEKVLTIPVERILARFSFKIAPDENGANRYDEDNMIFTPENNKIVKFNGLENGNHKYDQDNYRYRVKVTGWGINAMETQSHLFKRLKEGTEYFDEMYFNNWNDRTRFRSYWAEDPHYEPSSEYPKQFRQALDTLETVYYEKKYVKKENKNLLCNYSYDELNNNFESVLYSPENTYDNSEGYKKWDSHYASSRLHKLVGTHLIVCAELQTNLADKEKFDKGDFFCDREGVWYKNEEELFYSMIQTLSNEFKSQSTMKYKYKYWDEEVKTQSKEGETIIVDTRGEWFMYYGNTKITTSNYKEIYKELEEADNGCKATAKAYITNSDGQRILWFKDISIRDANGNYMKRSIIKGVDDRGNQIIEPIEDEVGGMLDHNHHKSMLYEWLGVIDHYREGKMYYAAPIENLKLNGEKNYGVVRNSWYQFSLADINDIGTSVDDPEEPIVPVGVEHFHRINFNIKILDWHNIDITLPW